MLDDAGNDGFCGLLFGEGGVEMIEILVIWIHEVYSGGVIDLIVALLHSLFVVYFIGPNFELFEALSKLDVIDTELRIINNKNVPTILLSKNWSPPSRDISVSFAHTASHSHSGRKFTICNRDICTTLASWKIS